MMTKTENPLIFETKRNRKLITPCCNKQNTDGKFVTYKGFPTQYGYCHSCGITKLPPTIYRNEKGVEFYWNESTNSFEETVTQMSYKTVTQISNINPNLCNTNHPVEQRFIDFNIVVNYFNSNQENNLLYYLTTKYGKNLVENTTKLYYIGTDTTKGTVFWFINIDGKPQKAKIMYYTTEGKRTNYFKVPYKNEDGYYSCLFGEHLLANSESPIILVESEKTALVCAIVLPNYTWLAYGGINGLTNMKLEPLREKKITIIPDMSEKAVSIMKLKTPYFQSIGIEAKIWDMTNGKSNDQLKKEGLYNCDLEDIIGNFTNEK